MTLSEKFKEALKDPNAQVAAIEMTPERKKHYERISLELIDWLKERCEKPYEAYLILHFVMETFKESYGFKTGALLEEGETKHG